MLSQQSLGAVILPASVARANRTGNMHGPPQVDYSKFSKMLASMLVLREGGIPEATQAIPQLAATTHHYLNTQVQVPPSITVGKLGLGEGATTFLHSLRSLRSLRKCNDVVSSCTTTCSDLNSCAYVHNSSNLNRPSVHALQAPWLRINLCSTTSHPRPHEWL